MMRTQVALIGGSSGLNQSNTNDIKTQGVGCWGHFPPNFGVVFPLNYFAIYECLCIGYAIHVKMHVHAYNASA